MEMVWNQVYMYRALQGAVAMRWKVKPTKITRLLFTDEI